MAESSSEFRDVHAARALLEAYIKSDKNLDVIRNLPINSTNRYDVWRCVFEKEREAYAVLQEKELYHTLMKYGKGDIEMAATLCIIILEKLFEFDSPLKVDDAIKIILDILGDEMLPHLKEEAKISYDRRVSIVKPYFKHDDEWVGYSKMLMKKLNKIKI